MQLVTKEKPMTNQKPLRNCSMQSMFWKKKKKKEWKWNTKNDELILVGFKNRNKEGYQLTQLGEIEMKKDFGGILYLYSM